MARLPTAGAPRNDGIGSVTRLQRVRNQDHTFRPAEASALNLFSYLLRRRCGQVPERLWKQAAQASSPTAGSCDAKLGFPSAAEAPRVSRPMVESGAEVR